MAVTYSSSKVKDVLSIELKIQFLAPGAQSLNYVIRLGILGAGIRELNNFALHLPAFWQGMFALL